MPVRPAAVSENNNERTGRSPVKKIMDGESFVDLVCETFKCSPEDFNETVFWLCVFPQALFLARWLWRWNRGYFKPDLELIEQVKNATDQGELMFELNDFRRHHPQAGIFRTWLKVRLSGERLLALGDKLFSKPV